MLIAHRIHIGDVVGVAFCDDPVFCRFHIRELRAVAAGEVQRFLRIDDYTGRFGTGACADSRPAGEIIRPAGFVVSVFVDDDRIFLESDAHPHSCYIHENSPSRIAKRSEKFSEAVSFNIETYGDFTDALEKARKAAREGFGVGSIVYLRKVFERIITQTAEAANPPIETRKASGNLKPFIQILTPVKDQCNIIPSEFAEDGYKLFGELSDVVHGDYDEDEALQKFDAFYRLVTGVLEKIKTNRELMDAIGTLGWHTGGEENE